MKRRDTEKLEDMLDKVEEQIKTEADRKIFEGLKNEFLKYLEGKKVHLDDFSAGETKSENENKHQKSLKERSNHPNNKAVYEI